MCRKDEYFDYYNEKTGKVYSFVLTYLMSKWDQSTQESSLLFISIIDVTEERKNDEIKAEFIVNASHELKTPITTISGFSELILNGAGKCDEKATEYIRRISCTSCSNTSLSTACCIKDTDWLTYTITIEKSIFFFSTDSSTEFF